VVFRRVFGRRQITMSRPTGIQHILVDNSANYRRTAAGIRILRPLLGRGLLLSRDEDWRQQRRTLAPAFAPRTMPILARHVAQAANAAVADLIGAGAAPVDLLAAMQFLALEIAGASMFSIEIERYGAELPGLIKGYAERLGRPGLLDFLLPPSLPSPRELLRWRFRRRWLRLIGRIIAARRSQGSAGAPRDLFDLMADARDPESGALFPPARLADQVATMIVAGHETTAVALFWSLYLLASAPEIQSRLAVEAAAIDLGPDNAAAALSSLVYTRAVVQEAMRLYPPAFTLARQAIRDDLAGGVPVKAKTVGADRTLGPESPSPAVERPRNLRPVALSARRPAARSLRLYAVRHRAARLDRRAIRLDRSGAGFGDADPRLPCRTRRRRPGHAPRHRHHPTRPPAPVPAAPAIRRVSSTLKRGFPGSTGIIPEIAGPYRLSSGLSASRSRSWRRIPVAAVNGNFLPIYGN
jgi:cytochrome P450